MLKSESVMQVLLQRCFSGELREGHLLPGEYELCEEFGVSRSSIRSALQSLSNKGIVSILPKRGSIINPLIRWNWLDSQVLDLFMQKREIEPYLIENLLTARLIFEPNICFLSAQVSSAEDISNIYSGYKLMEDGIQANCRETFIEGDKIFHSSIVISCQNPFLSSLDAILSTAMMLSFNKTLEEDLLSKRLPALGLHGELLESIRNRHADQAKSISKRLILSSVKKVVKEREYMKLQSMANKI